MDECQSVDEDKPIPNFLLNDKEIIRLDKEIKDKVISDGLDKLKKYAIPIIDIDTLDDVTPKIIELLEKHKYAKRS